MRFSYRAAVCILSDGTLSQWCGEGWLVYCDIILAVYRYVDICLSLKERDFPSYQKERRNAIMKYDEFLKKKDRTYERYRNIQ